MLKIRKCKWCGLEFNLEEKPKGWMANHSRWCNENPKREEYSKVISESRKSWTEETRKKYSEKISNHHSNGTYDRAKDNQKENPSFKGKVHTEFSKDLIRKKALTSDHRRLKKNTQNYNGVIMDSTWEIILAKRLDSINIKWERPKSLKWIDDKGIEHNYFPDFYLPDYDLYLDPKNPYAYMIQSKKINILNQKYNNIKFLLSSDECKMFSIENYII
jgi:hypothetical protein